MAENSHSTFITDTRWFYRDLDVADSFEAAANGIGQAELPADWWIVVADVVGSTKAIESGLYKNVNTVGAATIMAVLNVDRSIPVPYVFGGDGALMAVPQCLVEKTKSALLGAQAMSRDAFNMDLRIGMIPMSEFIAKGWTASVGKFRQSKKMFQTSLSGVGWAKADALMKDSTTKDRYEIIENDVYKPDADFTGFECRWQPVPARHGHKLAIVVQARSTDSQRNNVVYDQLLSIVYQIYGDVEDCHAVDESSLKLATTASGELKVRTYGESQVSQMLYALVIALMSIFSRIAFLLKLHTGNFHWGNYRQDLIQNTDFRKFDGAMKMVVDGSDEQRDRLTAWLDDQELQGRLSYGLHQSPAAIVTCLIFAHSDQHTHFVDGSDGGYAIAAKYLKQKLANHAS